ncbi:zinc ribbon domain-containing protein [Candidatus Neomarinimicrobiota bacterium]
MHDNLANLIKLQSIDSKIVEIEELLGDLPAAVKRLNSQISDLVEGVSLKEARLQEITKDKRDKVAKVTDTREKLKRYQDQLVVVSTNRAYDALMHEIDTCKTIIEESEFNILELDDESQRLTDEVKADRLKFGEAGEELKQQEASLKSTLADTKDQSAKLQNERAKIVRIIEERVLNIYNRIREARNGRAVVALARESCGVCFNSITPQLQNEVKRGNEIIVCDTCGVILYWDED